MGLSSCQHDHARYRHGTCCRDDRGKAPPRLRTVGSGAARLILLLCLLLCPLATWAEGFRIATLHAELTRKGPGLLLRDIDGGKDAQLAALAAINAAIAPDILFLSKVDFDAELRTAHALRDALGYSHAFALPPNSMIPTPHDLDGDGKAGDRMVWTRYAGEGAMLLLSNAPVQLRYHLNDLPWDGAGAPMKLVGNGLWVVDVHLTGREPITLVLFHNQTPAFDGADDQNGRRNAAQLALVTQVVRGTHGPFPPTRFALVGNSNLDPLAGEGARGAMAQLLADPRVQDPVPASVPGGRSTAIWERPGPMRVSYILPSADWQVKASGVFWPEDGPLRKSAEQASRHRMVWMDLRRAEP